MQHIDLCKYILLTKPLISLQLEMMFQYVCIYIYIYNQSTYNCIINILCTANE